MYRSTYYYGCTYCLIVASLLKYRLPGSEVVSLTGDFRELKDVEPDGFVVTNFEGSSVYQFYEGENGEAVELSQPVTLARDAYIKIAENLIAELNHSGGKTVFSRIQKEVFSVNPTEFFSRLCKTYPNAFVYLIQSETLGNWIGATPETLVSRRGNRLQSMALAGTRRSEGDVDWVEKEYEEHEFVADFIEDKVRSFNPVDFNRSDRKEALSGPVKHLRTDFHWETPPQMDWQLAQKLHPTPAVSGWPVSKALQQIKEYEPHKRELYTGIIGLVGKSTTLFVNLRCARMVENELYLYLGGGFTRDSLAEDEWRETENKAATLLNVLKKV